MSLDSLDKMTCYTYKELSPVINQTQKLSSLNLHKLLDDHIYHRYFVLLKVLVSMQLCWSTTVEV